MGICSSCLGGQRQADAYEEDEEAPLFDDPADLQYGSFAEQNLTSQDDDMEAQREMEALQRVMAKTSDNMVDIFEVTPQSHAARAPTAFPNATQGPGMSRYQSLLSRLSAAADDDEPVDGVYVDWLPQEQDGTIEMRDGDRGKGDDKPLVGTFADAAAAMV